jgi:DNA-binding response OmpR family regulator
MTTGRLLVVEDEPSISELISINLRHAGFTVVTAATAEAAREVVDPGWWCLTGCCPTAVALRFAGSGEANRARGTCPSSC